MCHTVSMEAFEAAADPERYPHAGDAVAGLEDLLQPDLHAAAGSSPSTRPSSPRGWSRRTPSGSRAGRTTPARSARSRPGSSARTGSSVRDRALIAHRTQVDPEGGFFRAPHGDAAPALADRGLRAGQGQRRGHACPRTTCSPGCADALAASVDLGDPNSVSPGILGFLAFFLLAVALLPVGAQHERAPAPDALPGRGTRAGARQPRPRAPPEPRAGSASRLAEPQKPYRTRTSAVRRAEPRRPTVGS